MKYVLIFLLLVCCIISVAQKQKHFSLYKTGAGLSSNPNFRTDGMYINRGQVKYSFTYPLCFYTNGIFYDGPSIHNTLFDFTNTEEMLKTMLRVAASQSCSSYCWGFYTIKNDTITTQLPQHLPGALGWSMREEKWIIDSNKIYKVSYSSTPTSYIFERRRVHPIQDRKDYEFYQSVQKPDSTSAWFFYEPWFQHLHVKK